METKYNGKNVNTNNKGWLDHIEPFESLRGKQNDNNLMGKAKDKDGNEFFIYPAECGLGNSCFCWATAEEVERK